MTQPLHARYFRLFFFAAILLFAHAAVKAQAVDTSAVKHVRLDVARMGLHCPFLGPKLVQKLKELPSAQNVTLFMQPSYITFDLPSGSDIVEEKVKEVAVKVGYPGQDVTVTIEH